MIWIKLTLADGSTLWLAPGAIYALEKSPNETTTVVKTAMEPFVVVESPEEVLDRIEQAAMPEMDSMAWLQGKLEDDAPPPTTVAWAGDDSPATPAEMQEQADFHGWEGEGHGNDSTRPAG